MIINLAAAPAMARTNLNDDFALLQKEAGTGLAEEGG